MADELRDLRARINVAADVAIDVEAKRRGLDRSELVREILDQWAADKIHAAHALIAGLTAEGISAADEGGTGNIAALRTASQIPGSPRR
jgi:hypothetical protein